MKLTILFSNSRLACALILPKIGLMPTPIRTKCGSEKKNKPPLRKVEDGRLRIEDRTGDSIFHPRSSIRYPLSAIRYPLSSILDPLPSIILDIRFSR